MTTHDKNLLYQKIAILREFKDEIIRRLSLYAFDKNLVEKLFAEFKEALEKETSR